MQQDFTINDAFHNGFECGLSYALKYAEEVSKQRISDGDISRLAGHLESKKPWRSGEEWFNLLNKTHR